MVGPVRIINNDSSPLEGAILEIGLFPDLGNVIALPLPKIHGGEAYKIETRNRI